MLSIFKIIELCLEGKFEEATALQNRFSRFLILGRSFLKDFIELTNSANITVEYVDVWHAKFSQLASSFTGIRILIKNFDKLFDDNDKNFLRDTIRFIFNRLNSITLTFSALNTYVHQTEFTVDDLPTMIVKRQELVQCDGRCVELIQSAHEISAFINNKDSKTFASVSHDLSGLATNLETIRAYIADSHDILSDFIIDVDSEEDNQQKPQITPVIKLVLFNCQSAEEHSSSAEDDEEIERKLGSLTI